MLLNVFYGFQDKLMDMFSTDVAYADFAFFNRTSDILVLAYFGGLDFSGSNKILNNLLRPPGSGYRAESAEGK